MDKKQVIETLFDKKVIKVLSLFINNPSEEYYLREIAKITKVPPASVYRILKMMLHLELLLEYKTKHLKTYVLNQKNSSFLIDLLEDKKSAIQEFKEFISSVSGVDMVVLHGREEKDKASILVIGQNPDIDAIRVKIVEIKEKYNFNIIHLVLSSEQYSQMLSMGLYPGQKIVLFSKNQ